MQPKLVTDSFDHYLLAIWLLQVSLVLGLACSNPNHYTTVDSRYYLEGAQNILNGKGYKVLQNGVLSWNSTFPIGYSISIAAMAQITGLSVLWASKCVNLAASALLLYCFRHWFGPYRAVLMGSLLLSGPFIKLWAHSWSEPLFLLVVISWHRGYTLFLEKKSVNLALISLLLGVLLFVVRYAGVFILPFVILQGIVKLRHHYRCGTREGAHLQVLIICGWTFSMMAYLFYNYLQSGSYYGGDRFSVTSEATAIFGPWSWPDIALWANVWSNYPPPWKEVIYFSRCFQILLGLYVIFRILRRWEPMSQTISRWVWQLASLGFVYLIFLFILRIYSPFDQLGYRLLAPFTSLICWALLISISTQTLSRKLHFMGLVILLISWITLLPVSPQGILRLQLMTGQSLPSKSDYRMP